MDFDISFVSLDKNVRSVNRLAIHDMSQESEREMNALYDIEGGKQHQLGFIILAHTLDMGFENFDNLLSVLRIKGTVINGHPEHMRHSCNRPIKHTVSYTYFGRPACKEFSDSTASFFRVHHLRNEFLTAIGT